MIRRTDTRSLKELIEEYLSDNKLDRKLLERKLLREWEFVVGKQVARSTRTIYFKERKLMVSVRSSVIRNELILMREELKNELNRRAGEKLVEEIVIK